MLRTAFIYHTLKSTGQTSFCFLLQLHQKHEKKKKVQMLRQSPEMGKWEGPVISLMWEQGFTCVAAGNWQCKYPLGTCDHGEVLSIEHPWWKLTSLLPSESLLPHANKKTIQGVEKLVQHWVLPRMPKNLIAKINIIAYSKLHNYLRWEPLASIKGI